jgi:hypothetical protein
VTAPILIVLAAGFSTRYGGDKQLEPVGPGGEILLDYGIYDAARAGFAEAVIVTRPELEPALRDHLGGIFGRVIAIRIVEQRLEQLPRGYSLPRDRRKPWGTAHAVLAARHEVRAPFVVMNADDFYGAAAFRLLAEHLRRVPGSGRPDFAAAGYRLRDTLSPHGGVSRAVCEVDAAGYLWGVAEVKRIREVAGELRGETVVGESVELSGDEIVSMNLWAATPVAFELLEPDFERFLRERGDDPEAEFLLSTSVNDHIERGEMRVRVIPTPGPWLGMTFEEDRPYVVSRIHGLVEAGEYPKELATESPSPRP